MYERAPVCIIRLVLSVGIWLLQLCVEEKMVLLADEVYQANVYVDDRQFISFRKVPTHPPRPHTSPHNIFTPRTSHTAEDWRSSKPLPHSFL